MHTSTSSYWRTAAWQTPTRAPGRNWPMRSTHWVTRKPLCTTMAVRVLSRATVARASTVLPQPHWASSMQPCMAVPGAVSVRTSLLTAPTWYGRSSPAKARSSAGSPRCVSTRPGSPKTACPKYRGTDTVPPSPGTRTEYGATLRSVLETGWSTRASRIAGVTSDSRTL